MALPDWVTKAPPRPSPDNLRALAAQTLNARSITLNGETLLIDGLDAADFSDIRPETARIVRSADACGLRIEIWLPEIAGHLAAGFESFGFRVTMTVKEDDRIGPHHILRRAPTTH